MIFRASSTDTTIHIGNAHMNESAEGNSRQNVIFEHHARTLFNKANQKFHKLTRISKYKEPVKQAQFLYATL